MAKEGSLPVVGQLELDDLQSPVQTKPFYNSMILWNKYDPRNKNISISLFLQAGNTAMKSAHKIAKSMKIHKENAQLGHVHVWVSLVSSLTLEHFWAEERKWSRPK